MFGINPDKINTKTPHSLIAGNELANALKAIGRNDIVSKVMRNESRVTDEREIKKAVSRASVADNVGSPELMGVSEQLDQALNQPEPEPAPAPSSPGADAALLSQHFAGDELLQNSAPAAAATRPEDDMVQPTVSAAPKESEAEAAAAADKQAAIANLVSALEEAKFEPAAVAARESVAGVLCRAMFARDPLGLRCLLTIIDYSHSSSYSSRDSVTLLILITCVRVCL